MYSVNGGEYQKDYLFKPTQKSMHYLDVKEKYVFGHTILKHEQCVEIFVE